MADTLTRGLSSATSLGFAGSVLEVLFISHPDVVRALAPRDTPVVTGIDVSKAGTRVGLQSVY